LPECERFAAGPFNTGIAVPRHRRARRRAPSGHPVFRRGEWNCYDQSIGPSAVAGDGSGNLRGRGVA